MTTPIREKKLTRFADSIGYIFSLDMNQKEIIIGNYSGSTLTKLLY